MFSPPSSPAEALSKPTTPEASSSLLAMRSRLRTGAAGRVAMAGTGRDRQGQDLLCSDVPGREMKEAEEGSGEEMVASPWETGRRLQGGRCFGMASS